MFFVDYRQGLHEMDVKKAKYFVVDHSTLGSQCCMWSIAEGGWGKGVFNLILSLWYACKGLRKSNNLQ